MVYNPLLSSPSHTQLQPHTPVFMFTGLSAQNTCPAKSHMVHSPPSHLCSNVTLSAGLLWSSITRPVSLPPCCLLHSTFLLLNCYEVYWFVMLISHFLLSRENGSPASLDIFYFLCNSISQVPGTELGTKDIHNKYFLVEWWANSEFLFI